MKFYEGVNKLFFFTKTLPLIHINYILLTIGIDIIRISVKMDKWSELILCFVNDCVLVFTYNVPFQKTLVRATVYYLNTKCTMSYWLRFSVDSSKYTAVSWVTVTQNSSATESTHSQSQHATPIRSQSHESTIIQTSHNNEWIIEGFISQLLKKLTRVKLGEWESQCIRPGLDNWTRLQSTNKFIKSVF